jgi:hypothetical protein
MGLLFRRLALLAGVALLLSGCAVAGNTGTTPGPSQSSGATEPGATEPGATPLQLPSAPADVVVTKTTGSIVCPDRPTSDECVQWDLAWRNTSGPGTRFRVYEAWSGGEDVTCDKVTSQAQKKVETPADATSAALIDERVMGNGWQCVWVAAFNSAGQSQLVYVEGI